MNTEPGSALKRLTVESLETCLARLSKVSAGTWRLESARVSRETLEEAAGRHDFARPAAAVHFTVKGEFPFAVLMLFDPGNIECAARCFLGYSFSPSAGITRGEEIMLLELGNIILNSVVSAAAEGMRRIFTPSVPVYTEAHSPKSLAAELGGAMDLGRSFRIITLTVTMQCSDRTGRCEVFGLIPEDLESELERRESGGTGAL